MDRSTGKVLRLVRLRRSARDLDRACRFYVEALGFVVVSQVPADVAEPAGSVDVPVFVRAVLLRLGTDSIELFSPTDSAGETSAERHEAAVSSNAFQHIAIVAGNMPAALDRLRRFGAPAISNPDDDRLGVMLPPAAGRVVAYKFRDPDGHPLELIAFPPGTGDPRWQVRSDPNTADARGTGPTLGIDHSAIGVRDADRSIAFYRDVLGFRVDARHTNQGPEQARLDGVAGVVVEVVALLPADAATPHLELLAYRSPPATRRESRLPIASDPSDRLTFAVDDLGAIAQRLVAARPDHEHGHEQLAIGRRALVLRDEDGHLLQLVQANPAD